MIRTIFAILFAIVYLILGIPVLGIEYLIGLKNPEKRDYQSLRMVQWAFRVINTICGVKVTVIGKEKIPTDRAVLYIANHQSYFDIMVSYSLCPTLTGYVAKDVIGKVPLLNAWMRRLYCIFMNRSDPKEGIKSIQLGIDYIKKGVSICIFPEGTRGDGKTLNEFKGGSFKMAERTGCPVVPVAITGTAAIIKDHMPFVKPTNVIIEYGDPIFVDQLEKNEKRALAKNCQEMIQGMVDGHWGMMVEK